MIDQVSTQYKVHMCRQVDIMNDVIAYRKMLMLTILAGSLVAIFLIITGQWLYFTLNYCTLCITHAV